MPWEVGPRTSAPGLRCQLPTVCRFPGYIKKKTKLAAQLPQEKGLANAPQLKKSPDQRPGKGK